MITRTIFSYASQPIECVFCAPECFHSLINNNDNGDTFQFHSLFRNELLYSTTHRAFYFVCSPIHGYSNDEIYMSAMSQSIEVVIFFISTPDQQRCAGGVQGGRFWLKQTYGLLPPPMHSTPKQRKKANEILDAPNE